MEITTAQFVKGILGSDEILHDGIPHIAFVGRSNVGKSSVINSFLGRKGLAKSSATPGKTKEINFFLVNGSTYVVDLPGYGFARMSAKSAEKLRKLIVWYLSGKEARPTLVVIVVDANIDPTPYDYEMVDILQREKVPFIILANKVDRLNQSERVRRLNAHKDFFGLSVFPYSAKTREGRAELMERVWGGELA